MIAATIPFPKPAPKAAPPPAKKRERNFVKVGTVKVRWYRLGDGRTMVDPRKYGRKQAAFPNHDEAIAHAQALAMEINAGGTEALALSAADRAEYARAREGARAHGCDLGEAMLEWRDARRKMTAAGAGALNLGDVVSAGIAALLRPEYPTATVVAEFLQTKKGRDYDGRHKQDLQTHLDEFATAFPQDIGKISPGQIEAWLNGRRKRGEEALGPKRWNDVLANVKSLFIFARSREMLPARETAAHKVAKRETPLSEVEVLTLEEMRQLLAILAETEPSWVPMVAMLAFGGMRVEEVSLSHQAAERKDVLRWEDLDWESHEIVVRAAVAKNKKPRRIPLPENLAQWLAPWREASAKGRIALGNMNRFRPRFRLRLEKLRLKEAAELGGMTVRDVKAMSESAREMLFMGTTISGRLIDWPHNALRHSYGSYRMAIIRNKHTLAYEMGNSVEMVERHYHNPRPVKEAKAWFEIRPSAADLGHLQKHANGTLPKLVQKRYKKAGQTGPTE